MQESTAYSSKFDLDLKYGQEGEKWLSLLADEKKMEIKRDNMWHKTGNIYIEYLYKGEPSGISITEADYFAVILSKLGKQMAVFIWETAGLKSALKRLAHAGKIKIKSGGDNNLTKGFIIPIEYLGTLTVEASQ